MACLNYRCGESSWLDIDHRKHKDKHKQRKLIPTLGDLEKNNKLLLVETDIMLSCSRVSSGQSCFRSNHKVVSLLLFRNLYWCYGWQVEWIDKLIWLYLSEVDTDVEIMAKVTMFWTIMIDCLLKL